MCLLTLANFARTTIACTLQRRTLRTYSKTTLVFENNFGRTLNFLTKFKNVKHQRQLCFIHCMRLYSTERKTVRIGCASGFWGDTATSVPQLVHGGQLDFLVFDYLSEITMSLLTAAKAKMPNMGYAPDFVLAAISPFIKDISQKGIRVVSNAGGTNPLACAAAIQEVVQNAGLRLKVAVVTGDDLMPQARRMHWSFTYSAVKNGTSKDSLSMLRLTDSEEQKPLPKTVHSINAYLGALPIKRCLDLGADIVVTGRCVDSAVVLGPLMHSVRSGGVFSVVVYFVQFGWEQENYDFMAAGSLAGHLIECGAQVTGGIFTDWHKVPDWDNIGFPVVECSADGSFTLSKPPKTGGLVSFGTVAEQLVYEIGDPQRYLLPDVSCDFSEVTITEIPGVVGGAVRVGGAKGSPPSGDYKVCATYMDGFRATAVCPVGGPRAVEKARRTAESIIKRTRRVFKQLGLEDYSDVNIQVLGAEDTYGPHAVNTEGLREAVLWLAVHHKQKKALEFFSSEVAPAGTGMAPGLQGIVGGRPRVSPVLKPFFFLHPKEDVEVSIHLNGQLVETYRDVESSLSEGHAPPRVLEQPIYVPTGALFIQMCECQMKYGRDGIICRAVGAVRELQRVQRRGKLGLDVSHDESLEARHDDGCECDTTPLRHDTVGFLDTGTMVVVLKHVGTTAQLREILKMSVRTSASCTTVSGSLLERDPSLLLKTVLKSRDGSCWPGSHLLQKRFRASDDRSICRRSTLQTCDQSIRGGSGALPDLPTGPHHYRLEDLAYTRSGDKGDSANIGIIARHPVYFPYLKKFMTAEVVEKYFQYLVKKDERKLPSVIRYELPGICGLNFVLCNSLGGGGVASLRSDPQGKAYGQMLLDYRLTGLPDLASLVH
ncbi:hypothetical protein P4O66_021298 [Electrophorus voltai]|uniref:Uncharacterized protein n=1 Tax=Electrophorus voltai TaxID=2609070 RepID=A0AAD8ZQQ8_9TELE|nr:hypothetical protein P4O66_021298 [Electrophorus voltai]